MKIDIVDEILELVSWISELIIKILFNIICSKELHVKFNFNANISG